LRFVLACVLFVLISLSEESLPGKWLWCLGLFCVAAVTDWLDGYLARKQGISSTLGRNLDPLVDKVLMCGSFIFLQSVEASGILAWMVAVIVSRELLVSSLRSFLENRGTNFGADWLGKVKMVLQCVALIAIFLYLSWQAVTWLEWTWVVRDILIYAMVVSTVVSGLQYLLKAAFLLRGDDAV
jgi:CDP-diacylglycerol--glycerol-3-phosphate 3-phosphatidyltransferase